MLNFDLRQSFISITIFYSVSTDIERILLQWAYCHGWRVKQSGHSHNSLNSSVSPCHKMFPRSCGFIRLCYSVILTGWEHLHCTCNNLFVKRFVCVLYCLSKYFDSVLLLLVRTWIASLLINIFIFKAIYFPLYLLPFLYTLSIFLFFLVVTYWIY